MSPICTTDAGAVMLMYRLDMIEKRMDMLEQMFLMQQRVAAPPAQAPADRLEGMLRALLEQKQAAPKTATTQAAPEKVVQRLATIA